MASSTLDDCDKKESILLFKSEHTTIPVANSPDQYSELFKKLRICHNIIPVLTFEFKKLDVLKSKLDHPENYAGIIFTSPRTCHAVQLACNGQKPVEWKEKPCFALGERTALTASTFLDLECEGSSSGCGYRLAQYIKDNSKKLDMKKPFLFPHSNLKTDSVMDNLKPLNIKADCVEVYVTLPHPTLEQQLINVLKKKKITVAIFFSPSGVQIGLPHLMHNVDYGKEIKLVAIGGTTEKCLKDLGFSVSGTAPEPTPEGLAEILMKILPKFLKKKK
uniref:Uroporphyrinogen-III synthase n=2 Tax=Clastoptera arizonana TaxID=38151 RepID=A0A1B6D6U8_9HEMI